MNSKLEKQANLLLLKNGYDENGRRTRKWKPLKAKKKKGRKNRFDANKPLSAGFAKEHKELIDERANSELSEGEYRVAEFLAKQGLFFEREKPMKGLFNPKTGKPLFFDFYISFYNLVIEYDGIFHYKNEDGAKLVAQKCKDDIKNNFCRTRRIHLLRIPFWKKNRIEHLICEKIDKLTTNGKERTSKKHC